MDILPAIDLRGGKVVRLAQGDFARETQYPFEPVALSQQYAADGAHWLHVVDLDGARSGRLENFRAIAALAGGSLRVQAGGGVREASDIERLLDCGVARVVVGSVAVTDPHKVEEWILRYGARRICVALDTRQDAQGRWTLPMRGWIDTASASLDELAPRYAAAGAQHLLCTDIARDGMRAGPNLELYSHLARIAPTLSVQASGGVRNVEDILALQAQGLAGVVLGRALLEGAINVAQALAC
jgi:phosphoribosylformimino-5-aminoimidazole carboxamide ribotide isomerase